MGPFCSIVTYEMQRVASSTLGSTNAPVGQASRQRGAAAAVVGLERPIDLQAKVGQHLADEEPGPEAGSKQHGVLADPAQSGSLGELPFGDWPGVHVWPRNRGPMLPQEHSQLFQPPEGHPMVVLASRIARDLGLRSYLSI